MFNNSGIALYLTIVILSVFTTVVLTLANISVSQIKISWMAGDSIKAFFSADTGVEQALYNIRKLDNPADIAKTVLSNNASYVVDIDSTPSGATIISSGAFRNVRRAIKAEY